VDARLPLAALTLLMSAKSKILRSRRWSPAIKPLVSVSNVARSRTFA
jgi:hypothetical protein